MEITVILNFMTDLIDIKLNPVSEVDAIHYYKLKIKYHINLKKKFSTYSIVMYLASVMYFAPTRAKFTSRHGWSGISQRSEISLDTGGNVNSSY
jgi:hypothetical protein